jgi:chorismate mutase
MSDGSISDGTLVFDAGHHDVAAAWLTDVVLRAPEPTVEELDEQLVALIQRRAEAARRDQLARRAEGLPARQLSGEHKMVQRYATRLGARGGDIAVAVLALSQPNGPVRPAPAPAPDSSIRTSIDRA